MAQINFDPLKYLGTLPEFNGDFRDLRTFLSLIDKIHPLLQQYDELSQSLFSDLIKGKLKGKAREVVEINCQAISWSDIRGVLQNNFGDRLSCDDLFDLLRATVFKSTGVEFYEEIKNKLRRLNNKTLSVLGQEQGGLNLAAQNNCRAALNVFKSKIPEPMKTILACRNPNSLEEAMNILFETGYAHQRIENLPYFNKTKLEQNPHTQRSNLTSRQNYNQPDRRQHYQNRRNFQPQNSGQFRSNFYPQNSENGRLQNNGQFRPNFYQQNNGQYNENFQPNNGHLRQNNYYGHNEQRNNFTQPNQNSRINNQNPFQTNNSYNKQPPPEPMDVNSYEFSIQPGERTIQNFQESASEKYHI